MFAPYPEEKAKEYARDFISQLEAGHELSNFNGMFGILVCKKCDESLVEFDAGCSSDYVVLRAFSGQCNSKWNVPGFVPALVDQTEYDKAVIDNDKLIHELSIAPEGETAEQKKLRDEKRIALCNETLSKIYDLYSFTCFDKTKSNFKNLTQKIKYNSNEETEKLLPTGTGDCCAPKLLSYAFSHNLVPVSMTEFYWGKPNTHLEHKKFYPPCDEKCGLILPEILGIEILYRDENIIVVNKTSGLLAVPGRGPDKQDCVVNRVKKLFPSCIEQPSVHRLDMDTSGLMVLAFDEESHRNLSMQFERGEVSKKYIAVLDGILKVPDGTEGQFKLKFRLDVDDRPHQIYDEVYGKEGITNWKKLRVFKMKGRDVTSVEFVPLTGRTHQLRLASSDEHGFGIPIVGDNLYGSQDEGQRLLLHSSFLCFIHPVTGAKMEFIKEPDFKY